MVGMLKVGLAEEEEVDPPDAPGLTENIGGAVRGLGMRPPPPAPPDGLAAR